jgi:transcriptional regulator with XRE-family HTH domain
MAMAKNIEEVVSPISADVVAFLRGQGLTLKKIGQLAGVCESYVSRVARRERNFTVDHLYRIEQQLKKPLPVLLLESTPRESVPRNLRKFYHQALRLLERTAQFRWDLAEGGKPPYAKPVKRAAG